MTRQFTTILGYKNLGFLIAVFSLLFSADSCRPARGDHVLDTWEASNQTFKVRIRKFDENASVVLGHNYFTVEAAASGSNKWHEFLAWRADNGGSIPRDRVQFVDHQTAYAFINSEYAVTTDAGHTWTVWDARKHVTNPKYLDQTLIKEVHLASDGRGRMTVGYPTESGPALAELSTTDYGAHWLSDVK